MTARPAPTACENPAAAADPQTPLDGHVRATGFAVVHRALAALFPQSVEPDTSSLAGLCEALQQEEGASC